MNYRHIYHAGNFADVTKHLALALILDHLKKKEAGFCAIDAHGGIGIYDLNSIKAQKTKEAESGILRFQTPEMPEDFALYHNILKDDLAHGHYPGSPTIIGRMLRGKDRLIANELHPEDVETLKANMRPYRNARVTHMDAYECVRAHTPPQEKRGVILIDPPFEKTDEFETLVKQMDEWKKRFAHGIYILWYPIKAHLAVEKMKEAAWKLDLPRTWCVETLRHPRAQEATFNGSGLIIFNAPYQIPERITALLPWLARHMDLQDCPQDWLTAP